jgi:hypothetical protein
MAVSRDRGAGRRQARLHAIARLPPHSMRAARFCLRESADARPRGTQRQTEARGSGEAGRALRARVRERGARRAFARLCLPASLSVMASTGTPPSPSPATAHQPRRLTEAPAARACRCSTGRRALPPFIVPRANAQTRGERDIPSRLWHIVYHICRAAHVAEPLRRTPRGCRPFHESHRSSLHASACPSFLLARPRAFTLLRGYSGFAASEFRRLPRRSAAR